MQHRAIVTVLLAMAGGGCSNSADTPRTMAAAGRAGSGSFTGGDGGTSSIGQIPSPKGGGGAEQVPSMNGGAGGTGGIDPAPSTKAGGEAGVGGEKTNLGGSGTVGASASDACSPVNVVDGTPVSGVKTNVALHRAYSAGSLGFPTPANAFDGDVTTDTDRANWYVVGYLAADLGSPTSLQRTVVTFGGQPTNYWIEGSVDGAQWSKILRVDTPSKVDERILPAAIYQYIRFEIDTYNAPGDTWALDKVSEIEVNAREPGDPVAAPPIVYPTRLDRTGWTASASSNSDAAHGAIDDTGVPPCNHFYDCYMCTNWSSGQPQAVGQWFQVDMGKATAFDRIEINDTYDHPDNIPPGYDVFVSDDGVTWGTSIANGNSAPNTKISFPMQNKRYIKVVIAAANATAFWRIADFGVFACGQQ